MDKVFSEVMLAVTGFGLVLTLTTCDTGLRGTAGVDHLLLEIDSNRSQVKAGDIVQIRFTITNTGQQMIMVESPDAPVMDISVSEVVGGTLLVWSKENPGQVSHRLEWEPGESRTIELVWIPRQEDVAVGYDHDVHFSGILNKDSKLIQAAGVTLCASDVCR